MGGAGDPPTVTGGTEWFLSPPPVSVTLPPSPGGVSPNCVPVGVPRPREGSGCPGGAVTALMTPELVSPPW